MKPGYFWAPYVPVTKTLNGFPPSNSVGSGKVIKINRASKAWGWGTPVKSGCNKAVKPAKLGKASAVFECVACGKKFRAKPGYIGNCHACRTHNDD